MPTAHHEQFECLTCLTLGHDKIVLGALVDSVSVSSVRVCGVEVLSYSEDTPELLIPRYTHTHTHTHKDIYPVYPHIHTNTRTHTHTSSVHSHTHTHRETEVCETKQSHVLCLSLTHSLTHSHTIHTRTHIQFILTYTHIAKLRVVRPRSHMVCVCVCVCLSARDTHHVTSWSHTQSESPGTEFRNNTQSQEGNPNNKHIHAAVSQTK